MVVARSRAAVCSTSAVCTFSLGQLPIRVEGASTFKLCHTMPDLIFKECSAAAVSKPTVRRLRERTIGAIGWHGFQAR